jgi:membrane-associated phospholipid phosphatase
MSGGSGQSLNTNWKYILGGFLACTALVALGHIYLDVRLATFVVEKFNEGSLNPRVLSDLPDHLFLFVCAVCLVSWSGRLCAPRSVNSRALNSLELIGWTVPLAFILKHLLKPLFGQLETRFWLLHPDQYGFHWLQGGENFSGFPSGHMAVFTALMLGTGRYFPFLRPAWAWLLFLLALALVVTQYHFFSDIVAGVYLGILVDSFACRSLSFFHR